MSCSNFEAVNLLLRKKKKIFQAQYFNIHYFYCTHPYVLLTQLLGAIR
jgi:hypothetical protein